MSLELIAAGKLLEMALGGIVGGAASEGAKPLWQTITPIDLVFPATF